MPYTPAQHRLFEAAAHSAQVAKQSGIPQGNAAQMAAEGVRRKPSPKAQILAAALRQGQPKP